MFLSCLNGDCPEIILLPIVNIPSTIGIPITKIAVANLAPERMETAASNIYMLVAPYPGKIFAGKKLNGKNPILAPAIINDNFVAIRLFVSISLNRRLRMPIIIAEIATIPGICPSTPLLQLSIFIIHTIHKTEIIIDNIGKPKS